MNALSPSCRADPIAAERTKLRLLTLNVHKGFSFLNRGFVLHELRDAVRIASADLVFLQEVIGVHQRHASRHARWPAQPQYEFLADSMWSQYAYGQNAVYQDGDHGNALLSKFPIVRHDNVDVSVGRHEKRGLLHCEIALPDRQVNLHAICVHLALRESHRHEQLAQLIRHVIDAVPLDAPLVVSGDFNDWRDRCTSRLRDVGLFEAFATRTGRCARTFPGKWPLLRLDRVYVRHAAIVDARVLGTQPWPHLSDHVPLFTEIAL